MSLALARTVLAAVLITGLSVAVAEPVATASTRRAPTLCVALTGTAVPLLAAGDLPDAEPVAMAAPLERPAAIASDEPPALRPLVPTAEVLAVAPKTSPPRS